MQENNGKRWGFINNGEIEILTLTRADLEEALDILDENFFKNEVVCIGCEINLPENSQSRSELRELCRITAEDGVSLIAKDVKSGTVAGVSFNKIQHAPAKNEKSFFEKFRDENTHSAQAKNLMDFMINVDSKINIFEMFAIDCLCELMFLATLSKYERKGVGSALGKYTIELAEQLSKGIGKESMHPSLQNCKPMVVSAIFTSQYSQKVGKANNFRVLNTVDYNSFSFNGKTYAQRVNKIHKCCEHVVFSL